MESRDRRARRRRSIELGFGCEFDDVVKLDSFFIQLLVNPTEIAESEIREFSWIELRRFVRTKIGRFRNHSSNYPLYTPETIRSRSYVA